MFYLNKLKIAWYGPLSFEGEAEFKPGVNLIIGKNGSGKTLTLKMLDGASKGLNPPMNQQEFQHIEGDELVKLILISDDDEPNTVTFIKTGSWQNIQVLQNKIRFITSDRSVRGELRTPNPFRQISDFSMPEPGTEINVSDEFNKAIIFELLQRIKKIKESIPDITKDIEEDYRQGLVDFEKDIRVDFEKDNPVYFIDHKGREVQIMNLSAGEKEYLYFYSFLKRIRDDENKIILIDEPELHLHGNQIRKLCELIEKISQKNQVIIATHSGEVLHHFLGIANIVLLNRGEISNPSVSEDLRKAIEEIGLPIDPSFFTAHWICAENNPGLPLKGEEAPSTEDVLGWIFQKDITKRFWAFGGNKIRAEAAIDILESASTSLEHIKLSVILDGDKLAKKYDQFPPTAEGVNGIQKIYYFPFWELENVFLSPILLDEIIKEVSGKKGSELFWGKVLINQENLLNSALKTITKNFVRCYWKDSYFNNDPVEDLRNWQQKTSALIVNKEDFEDKFADIIKTKNWKWIPGKEAISYVLELENDFWGKVRDLVESKKFIKILQLDPDIEKFMKNFEITTKI